MKSYSNGFGGTPIIPHFGEPPYAEILNVIHGQPMGCFFQVLGLFPWRTATIRNLAETALFVAVDVVKITAPDSLHPGKVWENPMKHIKIR